MHSAIASRAPSPVSSGRGHVIRIAAHAEAGKLGVNLRAALLRMFEFFKNDGTPAPSPSTKPSRSRSHGRLARCGSSLRSDSALTEQKPPSPSGVVAISPPPATIASASPY